MKQIVPAIGVVKGFQPPKNSKTASAHIINKFTNSARKKAANLKPLYSVLKPETISDSASGISKGVWFISASPQVKNKKNPTICGIIYQILTCAFTIYVKFKLPAMITTPIVDNTRGIS